MRVVCDIEANGLESPTEVWVICCLDVDTGNLHIFRKVTQDVTERLRFLEFAKNVTLWIGHNLLGYDLVVLRSLLGLRVSVELCVDTLIISQLVDFSRPQKHSLAAYGLQFGKPKLPFTDFTQYSTEMEIYCVQDVQICRLVFEHYAHILGDIQWQRSIRMEHKFQLVVNALHANGFYFNSPACRLLLSKVTEELAVLDKEIEHAFPPTLTPVKEVHPKITKYGTLSLVGFKFLGHGDLSEYNGGPFTRCEYRRFNPSSSRQIVEQLNKAGWRPVNKTKTHIQTERDIAHIERSFSKDKDLDLKRQSLYTKLSGLKKTGWKVDEKNLGTLPPTAPGPAKTLAKRILLESRRRTLTEWLGLVNSETGRIHGQFYGIGCWTHRMAHRHPNTANIPTHAKLYGAEMRALWCAPKKRLLVGVDAEAIQLRIFAHYIDDPEFTNALVNGRKDDKTDPHSLNATILGSVCAGRQIAKRFIFALLLGAGIGKLAEILGCDVSLAQEALNRLIVRYPGLKLLRETVIPADAARGYFIGLDGRRVPLPGLTEGTRRHLAMSGYLQNGEALVMKYGCILWCEKLCPQIFS